MLNKTHPFSGFSIDDVAAATQFYGRTLGLDVQPVAGMEDFGMLELHTNGNNPILLYQKDNHQPASFTVLSFPVDDIDMAVDWLVEQGVTILRYDNMHQDDKGITRGRAAKQGPDIAWFSDPAGNVLSVLQND